MKRVLCLALLLTSVLTKSFAQDEGTAVAQARFERDKSVYFGGGVSLPFGDNLGDYSIGLNFEGGFLKRLNKIMSLGGSVSYLNFKYDSDKTYPYYYDVDNDYAIEATLTGGDVSLLSVGFSLKINFVPVSDNTVFSLYAIGTPFISFVNRKECVQAGDFYEDLDLDGVYTDYAFSDEYLAEDYPALAKESKTTGGLHVGIGFEINPVKKVSIFGQATLSYTLPISYVATNSFLKEEDEYVDANDRIYYDASESFYLDEFPIKENGFTALSFKFGVSFNF
jgi:hypothetical protein